MAVVALAGGPGQATLPLAQFIEEAIGPALATRDLLLFDQRGTGASGALSCAALSAVELRTANSFSEVIQRCARQLGPARGAYTTRESVEDLEAIRQAAGYEKLVLYGTSYGTKVALDYAQRYPQNVASLVLDSTSSRASEATILRTLRTPRLQPSQRDAPARPRAARVRHELARARRAGL